MEIYTTHILVRNALNSFDLRQIAEAKRQALMGLLFSAL
jgi:hypothetical protein